MKTKNILSISLLFFFLMSCTENQRARSFGGTETFNLKPNHIVLNVTWKKDDMWICTKDTIKNIVYFHEKSSFGLMEGQVIIK
jgi:hypothetical protein